MPSGAHRCLAAHNSGQRCPAALSSVQRRPASSQKPGQKPGQNPGQNVDYRLKRSGPIVVLALLGLILISVTVTKMLKEMKHVDKMFGKKSRDVFISS